MTKLFIALLALAAATAPATFAFADCTIVSNDKKLPFDGEFSGNLMIEKRSMLKLDRLYPQANIVERIFKGELVTCSNCSDQYVICAD